MAHTPPFTLRRKRRADLDALAETIEGCGRGHRCRHDACPLCLRARQRWFVYSAHVAAGRAAKAKGLRLVVLQALAMRADGFELSVANEGKPIAPADVPRLFQPFYRGVGRPSRHGLGLGLYIAHEIAGAHGGTLEVASSLEVTRFTFCMPKS